MTGKEFARMREEADLDRITVAYHLGRGERQIARYESGAIKVSKRLEKVFRGSLRRSSEEASMAGMTRYRYHIHADPGERLTVLTVWARDRVLDVQHYRSDELDALLIDVASWEENLGLSYAAGRPVTWAEACAPAAAPAPWPGREVSDLDPDRLVDPHRDDWR